MGSSCNAEKRCICSRHGGRERFRFGNSPLPILSKNKFDVVATGKIDFREDKEVNNKFRKIRSGIQDIWEDYNFQRAVIEQSVYIQNFQSSRIISYSYFSQWLHSNTRS